MPGLCEAGVGADGARLTQSRSRRRSAPPRLPGGTPVTHLSGEQEEALADAAGDHKTLVLVIAVVIRDGHPVVKQELGPRATERREVGLQEVPGAART